MTIVKHSLGDANDGFEAESRLGTDSSSVFNYGSRLYCQKVL